MSEQETREGSGGWEVPVKPDRDGICDELMESNFTFRKLSAGPEVFLRGVENGTLHKIAARYGYTLSSVEVVEGPHSVRVQLERKETSRHLEDAQENRHRIPDDEEDNE